MAQCKLISVLAFPIIRTSPIEQAHGIRLDVLVRCWSYHTPSSSIISLSSSLSLPLSKRVSRLTLMFPNLSTAMMRGMNSSLLISGEPIDVAKMSFPSATLSSTIQSNAPLFTMLLLPAYCLKYSFVNVLFMTSLPSSRCMRSDIALS